jgi:hypothetical protein
VPVLDRLAVVVADTVSGAVPVAEAHTLRLGVALTLGDDVCEFDRVPGTVAERLCVEVTLTVPDTEGQELGDPEGVPEKMRLDVGDAVALGGAVRVAGSIVAVTQLEGVVLRVSVCVGVPLRLITAEVLTEAEPVALTDRVPVAQGVADRLAVMDPDTEPDTDTEPVPEMDGVMERVAEREAESVFVPEGDPDTLPVTHPVTDVDSEGDMEKDKDTEKHPVDVADTVAESVKAAEPLNEGLADPEKVSSVEEVEDGVPVKAPVKEEDTEGLIV